MEDFKTALNETFGVKDTAPKPEPVRKVTPVTPKNPIKSLGSPEIVAQAQKIYAPAQPKAPPAPMINQGTGTAMAGPAGWGGV